MLEDIIEMLKTLGAESSERNWKINDMTECVEYMQQDFIGVKQRIEILKSASKGKYRGEDPEDICDDLIEDIPEELDDIQECVDEVKVEMKEVEGFSHPCGGLDWTLVAFLNMEDPSQNCPSPWTETDVDDKRTCSGGAGPVQYTDLPPYIEVCGQIRGYASGSLGAFGEVLDPPPSATLAEYTNEIRGAVVLSGTSEHIWTFAAGEQPPNSFDSFTPDRTHCPCLFDPDAFTAAHGAIPIAGDDYFCESLPTPGSSAGSDTSDAPLWDGLNCETGSLCCSRGTPPIFTKVLPASTTDDIQIMSTVDIFYIELYIRGPEISPEWTQQMIQSWQRPKLRQSYNTA